MENTPPQAVDWLIRDTTIVSMNPDRQILKNASLAVTGDRISHIGPAAEVEAQVTAREVVDGRRFVLTPGYVNGHIHITGEPISKGYVPDDSGWAENVLEWLIPLYMAQTPEDEKLSAQLAAMEMLRTGTTTFLEAGSILNLAEVRETLLETGIRGRIGQWCQDRLFEPDADQAGETEKQIRKLDEALDAFPERDGRILVWPLLVGHNMMTTEMWQHSVARAKAIGGKVCGHMSPVELDVEWYLANTGLRPFEYLADIGVLGPELCLTHVVHLDDNEVKLAAESGVNLTHCPMSALKGAYGAGPSGRFPELVAAGANVMLGTDGNNNGNSMDMMRSMYLAAGLFKDARRDPKAIPAHEALTMGTLNGAKALGLESEIGSIEVGKKADFVLHDTDRPEWRPLLNVVNQLIWSADGRSVHSVWVDGQRLVENYRCLTIDEERVFAQIDEAGKALVARSKLPDKQVWPII